MIIALWHKVLMDLKLDADAHPAAESMVLIDQHDLQRRKMPTMTATVSEFVGSLRG